MKTTLRQWVMRQTVGEVDMCINRGIEIMIITRISFLVPVESFISPS